MPILKNSFWGGILLLVMSMGSQADGYIIEGAYRDYWYGPVSYNTGWSIDEEPQLYHARQDNSITLRLGKTFPLGEMYVGGGGSLPRKTEFPAGMTVRNLQGNILWNFSIPEVTVLSAEVILQDHLVQYQPTEEEWGFVDEIWAAHLGLRAGMRLGSSFKLSPQVSIVSVIPMVFVRRRQVVSERAEELLDRLNHRVHGGVAVEVAIVLKD